MSAEQDPFQPHLIRADALFASGDVVQAGQIWQAILKRDPANPSARAGLYQVKRSLEARGGAGDRERLLREGCTLFEMGQAQDALAKWEQILAVDPGHKLARTYANDARRELGMEPLHGAPGAPPEGPDAPGAAPDAPREDPTAEAERLVLEGVQLFDMGMAEEAMVKWRRALELDPGQRDAPGYLALAGREQAAAARPAAPAPVDTQLEARIQRAELMLRNQRLPEAAQAFQQLMDQGARDPRIMAGYQQARALMVAQDQSQRIVVSLAEPLPPPPARPALDLPPLVAPPRALTTRNPAPRAGLRIPAALKAWRLPRWLQSPRNMGITAGAAGLALLGLTLYGVHRREAALREAVAEAKRNALQPVSRMVQIPNLTVPLEAVRREAEGAMPDDPLLAYFRAQEWQRLDPDDNAATLLLQKAKDMLSGPPPQAAVDAFEKDLQSGNLEGGRTLILGLLRHDPDDLDLRARARRVLLALVPLYAAEEKMEKAKAALVLGRALFPQDPGWQARLKLLEAIQAMAKPDRAPWIQLLG
jgi:tetratricopeptide (TPR) repeat protein